MWHQHIALLLSLPLPSIPASGYLPYILSRSLASSLSCPQSPPLCDGVRVYCCSGDRGLADGLAPVYHNLALTRSITTERWGLARDLHGRTCLLPACDLELWAVQHPPLLAFARPSPFSSRETEEWKSAIMMEGMPDWCTHPRIMFLFRQQFRD